MEVPFYKLIIDFQILNSMLILHFGIMIGKVSSSKVSEYSQLFTLELSFEVFYVNLSVMMSAAVKISLVLLYQ